MTTFIQKVALLRDKFSLPTDTIPRVVDAVSASLGLDLDKALPLPVRVDAIIAALGKPEAYIKPPSSNGSSQTSSGAKPPADSADSKAPASSKLLDLSAAPSSDVAVAPADSARRDASSRPETAPSRPGVIKATPLPVTAPQTRATPKAPAPPAPASSKAPVKAKEPIPSPAPAPAAPPPASPPLDAAPEPAPIAPTPTPAPIPAPGPGPARAATAPDDPLPTSKALESTPGDLKSDLMSEALSRKPTGDGPQRQAMDQMSSVSKTLHAAAADMELAGFSEAAAQMSTAAELMAVARTAWHARAAALLAEAAAAAASVAATMQPSKTEFPANGAAPVTAASTRRQPAVCKLPLSLPWHEDAKPFLSKCDCTSAKAVCIAIDKAAIDKSSKAAAMSAVIDLSTWVKKNDILFTEPYLVTLFSPVMALCADKDRKVQERAEEAGAAMMAALSPLAVDAMLPLLFREFDEHRWQTKHAAVKLFTALARSAPKAVSASLPKIVTKLMDVSQDPKPAIKEAAIECLTECCQVIVSRVVGKVISSSRGVVAVSSSSSE